MNCVLYTVCVCVCGVYWVVFSAMFCFCFCRFSYSFFVTFCLSFSLSIFLCYTFCVSLIQLCAQYCDCDGNNALYVSLFCVGAMRLFLFDFNQSHRVSLVVVVVFFFFFHFETRMRIIILIDNWISYVCEMRFVGVVCVWFANLFFPFLFFFFFAPRNYGFLAAEKWTRRKHCKDGGQFSLNIFWRMCQ